MPSSPLRSRSRRSTPRIGASSASQVLLVQRKTWAKALSKARAPQANLTRRVVATLRLLVRCLERTVTRKTRRAVLASSIQSSALVRRRKVKTPSQIQACLKYQYYRHYKLSSTKSKPPSHLTWSRTASTNYFTTPRAKITMHRSHLRISRKIGSHLTIRTSKLIRHHC